MPAAIKSYLSVKAWTPNVPANFMGFAYIDPGSSLIIPYLPSNPSVPTMGKVQNAASPGGGVGTGIPAVSGLTHLD